MKKHTATIKIKVELLSDKNIDDIEDGENIDMTVHQNVEGAPELVAQGYAAALAQLMKDVIEPEDYIGFLNNFNEDVLRTVNRYIK